MMSTRWIRLLLFVVWIGAGGIAHANPNIQVTPDAPQPIDFGGVRFKDTATTPTTTKDFVIKKTGSGSPDLMVTEITFTNGDYTLTSSPGTIRLAPGAQRTITVELNPSVIGPRNGSMTLVNNDSNKTINLTGTGTAAVISVPGTIDFGTVISGVASPQNVAITNTAAVSQGPLTGTGATITGSTFFAFNDSLHCTDSTHCTFSPALVITSSATQAPIVCQPPATASGPSTGTITFESDSDAGGTSSTTLTCTATRPDIVVSASALNFTGVAVGRTSQPQTVTITNNGTAPLLYSLAENPDLSQFTITADCTSGCMGPPAPAAHTATFTVTFTPSSPTTVTTRIDISSNDPDQGDNVKKIDISGTGDQGVLAVVSTSPIPLDFGGVPQGTTKLIPFTLKNSGNVRVEGITRQQPDNTA